MVVNRMTDMSVDCNYCRRDMIVNTVEAVTVMTVKMIGMVVHRLITRGTAVKLVGMIVDCMSDMTDKMFEVVITVVTPIITAIITATITASEVMTGYRLMPRSFVLSACLRNGLEEPLLEYMTIKGRWGISWLSTVASRERFPLLQQGWNEG